MRTAFSIATTVFPIVVVYNLARITIEEQQGVVCIPATNLLILLDSDSRTATLATVIRTAERFGLCANARAMILLKRMTVMTANNGMYQISINIPTSAIRRGSDNATLSIKHLHRSSGLELLITSHPDKRLVPACE
jgi:hypothetical protein